MLVAATLIAALNRVVVYAGDCAPGPDVKPVLVSGRFCGHVVQSDGSPGGHVGLVLRDADDKVAAMSLTDAKGRFAFPPLPKGHYRIAAHDSDSDEIEITSTSPACRKRETIRLPFPFPVAAECAGGLTIERPDPSVVRGSGLTAR